MGQDFCVFLPRGWGLRRPQAVYYRDVLTSLTHVGTPVRTWRGASRPTCDSVCKMLACSGCGSCLELLSVVRSREPLAEWSRHVARAPCLRVRGRLARQIDAVFMFSSSLQNIPVQLNLLWETAVSASSVQHTGRGSSCAWKRGE